MNCVRPTLDSLFGDVPDLDSRKAAEIARTGKSGKALGLQSVANLFMGKCSKKKVSGHRRKKESEKNIKVHQSMRLQGDAKLVF